MRVELLHDLHLKLPPKMGLIGLSVVTAVGVTLSNLAPALAQAVFETQQILNFQMQQGRPEWAQNNIERINGAVWQFNPDGTFIYAPANARDDLYPLRGTYQNQGNTLIFTGERTSRIGGTSSAHVFVQGQVDFSRGQPVLTMNVVSGMASGAVINKNPFGFNNTSAYRTTVLLRQVR